jgi:hypothetical protein
MNELEKKYRITYNGSDGYYVIHMLKGAIIFYKDKNGLPFNDLDKLAEEAATLLVQTSSEEEAKKFVQTVQGNYKGYTQKEVL